MKVNLATQTLSSSVADALECCENHLKLPQFNGCGATVKFIRVFDRLFDISNSRIPLANNYKALIRKTNYQKINKFVDEAIQYIKELVSDHKDEKSKPMLKTKRKIGFLGFLVCIDSCTGLAEDLVNAQNPVLKYLLTHKTSQDHLELFFGAVRSSGGWNNNPTTRLFVAAYKQLLMRHNIKRGNGNCIPQDDTEILQSVQDKSVELCHLTKFLMRQLPRNTI